MSDSVLVTGAFGNIGSRTVRHLLAAGHRVVAVDLRTRKTAGLAASFGGALEVVWGNICDPSLWPRVLPGIDTVVHLAAIIPPAADRKPELATAVNQRATIELVKQLEASPTAKRLIFASSMVVAGHEQLGPLKPEVLRPGPPYFFGDWVDTTESQKLLAFQRHGLDDILSEMRHSVGFRRWLLKMLAPLVNPILERRSPHIARN